MKIREKKITLLSLVILALLSLGAIVVQAVSPPTTISYQGFLTDSSGKTIESATYGIKVELFEAMAGGTAVYTETHSDVAVDKGRFAIELGSGTTSDTWSTAVDFSKSLWLQITMDTAGINETLSPRVALRPAPYARMAMDAADGIVTENKLADSLAFDDGDLLNLSGIDASGTSEGLILPQATDVSSASAEGQISWDTDNDTLHVGTGSGQIVISEGGFASNNNLISAGDSDDDFVFGSSQLAKSDASDENSRMFFDKSKGAFRVGQATSTQWDESNVGNTSFASGSNTTASGASSTAMGSSTIASGNTSTALGYQTTASGTYSNAMGYNTKATGDISTTMGFGATASGNFATAMGSSTTASGAYSTAMGNTTTASSYISIVGGRYNTDRSSENANSWVTTESLFVLGNGASTANRSDAFVVLKSGDTTINGALSVNGANTVTGASTFIGASTTTGIVSLTNGNTSSGILKIYEDSDGGTDYIALQAASTMSASVTYTLPSADGSSGQVLSTDGNGALSWVSSSGSGGGGGFSSSNNLISAGDSDDDFVFGSSQLASSGSSDENSRMFFDKSKGAFRVGQVTSTQWDDSNVGTTSFATGSNTTASGTGSTAMGFQTTASGQYATAMGLASTASGNGAIAIGAQATASSDYSVAMGITTTASGNSSTAMGAQTKASATGATAMGGETTASEEYATAMGNKTTASGKYSTAMGLSTTASGGAATAMGQQTTASGDLSTAMGWLTTASGNASTVMGLQTTASSYLSIVGGHFNTVRSSETAGSWVSTDSLFVLGNGTGTNAESDALVILKNGNGTLAGTLSQNSDIRLKHNIEPLSGILSKLIQLQGVTYEFKNTTTHPEGVHIGVIAQEINEVFPELVSENNQGYLSVAYDRLAPILLEGIKEQQTIIEQQKAQLEQQASKLEKIEAALKAAGIVID